MVDVRPWPELQEELPPLSQSEKQALKDSIKDNGVKVPIIILPDGRIIDGHHRWEVSDGNTPFEIWDIDENEAFEWGLRLNDERRHLSPEQRKELTERRQKRQAEKREKALKLRQEGKGQVEAAEAVGVTQQAVSKWQKENNTTEKDSCISFFPDLRLIIPKSERERIYTCTKSGATHEQVAADYKVTRQRITQIVNKERKNEEKREERKRIVEELAPLLPVGNILIGDFRELSKDLPDNSIDLIFTDPPYYEKDLPLYGDLAELGARVLKPGGSLLCYAGHYALPTIFDVMTPHLRYWWILCVQHSGKHPDLIGKRVYVLWKPILWFVKENRGDNTTQVPDLVKSEPPDKEHHEWEQSTVEAKYYIDLLTQPGDLILDPFCGGGTTCVAAKELGRRYIAYEIDEARAIMARKRLNSHGSPP